jgi:D-3-phosphoglycerate dehydrogenase
VLNVVNLSRQTPASHVMVVRHRDRPGVLAHVFDVLRDGHVNVQETENIIFTGAEAAVARINLDGAPTDDQIRRVKAGNADIFEVHVVPLGAPAASYQLAKSLTTW